MVLRGVMCFRGAVREEGGAGPSGMDHREAKEPAWTEEGAGRSVVRAADGEEDPAKPEHPMQTWQLTRPLQGLQEASCSLKARGQVCSVGKAPVLRTGLGQRGLYFVSASD